MNTPQKAIILAAGMATRMFPLCLDTPKSMMPLWGKPGIGHLLGLLARWGVKEALINLHFNPSPICEYLKREPPANLRVSFSFEPEILGTGGVLRRAGWFLDSGPFWMVNADIAAALTPFRLLAEFTRPKTIAALWMEPERGPRTVEIRDGNVINFQTSRPGTKGTYTFCGLQLISPALLRYLPNESFCGIVQAYQNAIQDGRHVRGVCVPGSYWADLGMPESYLQAHAEIRARYRQKLPGQLLFNPCQDRLIAGLRKNGVLVQGFASIDQTVKIHPGARIENAVIWRQAVIGPNAIVRNAVVGSACEINGRVPRLAVKSLFNEQYSDIQLNLAFACLKLDPARTTIMPFAPRGSARSFTRLAGRGQSCIMIRYSRERHENCLYAQQAVFLKKTGLNVPAVIADFPERQFTLIQDLGDISLQQIAGECWRAKLIKYYRRILKAVVFLHTNGATRARREHLEMVASFSPDLYRWEHEFFGRFFLTPYLRLPGAVINGIMAELSKVGHILNRERQVLIHRDLQSSNILFHKNRPHFIDFQGMRFGPAAYDLASLLCDPYINLTLAEQNVLLDFYNNLMGSNYENMAGPEALALPIALNAGKGRAMASPPRRLDSRRQISPHIFWLAGIQRLCQALGAYGRLAANADTARFAKHIPPAMQMMRRALEQAGMCPRLYAIISTMEQKPLP